MSLVTVPEGDWICGITIRQPWTACSHGDKRVENRPRAWSRRGWALLHAGKQIDRPLLRNPLVASAIRGLQLPTGAVVGVARLIDCHQDPGGSQPCSPWGQPGRHHLVLADIQALALPIYADGQLGPWKPTEDLVAQVLQQLPDLRP
jgi:hypothetical protein